ncbi:hypothetical protein B1R27_27000 [Streptomyces sp. GKU 895]|nr:hypothetical protein B1R27_27000 [Streptomyces sp. GKU 895]
MPTTGTPLSIHGHDRYSLADHLGITEEDASYRSLRAAYDDLPADPYAPGSGRYRRYARGMFLPWSREFIWMPATETQRSNGMHGYYQGDHNPEYPGIVRDLAAISDEVCGNQLLQDMVQFDFEQTRWSEDDRVWPLFVGVHLIKLHIEEPGREAVSSPNELHQDGEPYVFCHLVYKHNAEGGSNLIATPPYRGKQPDDVPAADRLAEFELTRPLESYAVADHLVSHYVGPIRKGSAPEPGERAIVLTDWVPMRHRI